MQDINKNEYYILFFWFCNLDISDNSKCWMPIDLICLHISAFDKNTASCVSEEC